jgi:hypothetical protein
MKNSVVIPKGKIVYGYGGKKYKPGMVVNDIKTSSQIVKKLQSPVKSIEKPIEIIEPVKTITRTAKSSTGRKRGRPRKIEKVEL